MLKINHKKKVIKNNEKLLLFFFSVFRSSRLLSVNEIGKDTDKFLNPKGVFIFQFYLNVI